MFIRFTLLLCAATLGGAELTPGTYQSPDGVYLTITAQRAVLQLEDGRAIVGFRLVKDENGQVSCYHFGSPTGTRIEADPAGIAIVTGDERNRFATCATPPQAIGWQPYILPATEPDAAKRKAIAKELIRRYEHEQHLRREAIAASGGRMDAETMAQPEVSAKWTAINAADEENRRWLLDTIRTSGWIGRKSHGAPAHQALLLIALHNVSDLRFGATVLEQMQAERQRKELDEGSVANIADRLALIMGDPMTYGIQAAGGADGKPIIPIIADAAQVDVNRARIGQPPLATAAKMMQATVLRLDDEGRLVGEGAAEATGLDAIDMRKALAEPAWGLAQARTADADLGVALAAADQGDSAPLAAWTKAAAVHHRQLLGGILQGLTQAGPDGDAEAAIVARRALFDGFLNGTPAGDDARILVANLLAYGLTARSAAPSDEELARAETLAKELTAALKRSHITKGPYGHAIADTIACVRYRQGKLAEAVKLWQQAIHLAGPSAPELYRQRWAVAETGDAATPLPR